MSKTCQDCGYTRTAEDDAKSPAWSCPKCGAAYVQEPARPVPPPKAQRPQPTPVGQSETLKRNAARVSETFGAEPVIETGSTLNEFLNFRAMLTPAIIKLAFFIGTAIFIVAGVFKLFTGEVLNGLLAIAVGPVWLRIVCEFIIVVFSVHESIEGLRHDLARQRGDNH